MSRSGLCAKFMPGEDAESALVAAEAYRADGIAADFTRLGGTLVRIEDAERDRRALCRADRHDQGTRYQRRGLGQAHPARFDDDEERTFTHVARLAERAGPAGQTLWVDMEGSAYVERTIAL